MTDKKPIDAEIKKALECCLEASGVNCGKCPYCDNCVTDENTSLMMIDVLDLLNRLQAEVENYKQIAENQQKIILDKAFEKKRLRTSNDALRMANELCKGWEERAKAEAYKEFAEGLKEKATQKFDWNEYVEVEEIDNLLKELVGEDNG